MTLTLDVYGITLLVIEKKRIVFPDGRKPRLAVADGSVIESHQPFIAFEQGTYVSPPDLSPKFSYRFDMEGAGVQRFLDAWLLDGHTISVPGPVPAPGELSFAQETRVWSMRSLAPALVLSPDVANFSSKAASGWVDVSTATVVKGKAYGNTGGILIQEAAGEDRIANQFSVQYDTGAPTTIRISKGPGDVTSFGLTGTGPWKVMAGNVPLDQLFGAGAMSDTPGSPLTHLELVYDLYDIGPQDPRPVPRLANGHIHAMTTASGICGPGSTG